MATDLGQLKYVLSLEDTGFKGQLAAAEGQVKASSETMGSSLAATGKSMKSVGHGISEAGAAFMPFSLAAGVGLGFSIKAATDFHQSMMLVQTQAGASAKEVANLTSKVEALAPVVGKTPKELADALFYIESSGIRGAKAMDVLKLAAEGASVGQTDVMSTTNALTSLLNSNIKGAENATVAMANLNGIVGAGKMHFSDLNAAISTGFFGAAGSFGVSLDSAGAAIAALTRLGMPAVDAANRLRMSMTLMSTPTNKAQKVLQAAGFTMNDIKTNSDAMTGALAKAHVKTSEMAAALQQPDGFNVAIELMRKRLDEAGIHGNDAASVISAAFGGGRTSGPILQLLKSQGAVKDAYDQLGQSAGQFGDSVKAQNETSKQAMDRFKASVATLGIQLGDALLPTLDKVVGALSKAAAWFGHLSSGWKTTIVVAALVVAAIGPVLSILGSLVTVGGLVITAVSGIGAAFGLTFGASKLAKVTEGAGKSVGGFIEGVMKPLGSSAVLRGAASAALIGGAIYLIAIGVNQASKDKINIANLAILMGATVVVAGIFSLLSFLSEFAIPGAITAGIVGAGLWVAAEGISRASKLSADINKHYLLNLSEALAVVATVMALILPMAAMGSVGSILSAVISEGLVVAATGLLTASNTAAKINGKSLDDLFSVIKKLGNMNAGSLMGDLSNMVKTAALSKSAAEIRDTSVTLNQVQNVKSSVFDNMKSILEKMGKLDAGNLFKDWGTSQASGSLAGTAKNILHISDDLSKVKVVDATVMNKIGKMIEEAGNIKFGGFWSNWGESNASKKLADSIKNIVQISKDIHDIKMVSVGDIANIDMIQKFIDKAGNIKFNITAISGADLQAMTNSGVQLANNFVNGVKTLFSMAQNAGHQLQSSIWQAIQTHMGDEYNQGRALSQQVINGLNNGDGGARDAGHHIQSSFWQAIQGHFNDAYQQGLFLARQVTNGLNNIGYAAWDAGHHLQSSFWSAVQSHFGDEYWQGHAMAAQVVNGLYSEQGAWWSAGDSVASGFAGGIRRNIWQATSAAASMGQAAAAQIRAALGIHSPSTVFADIGHNVSLGLAQGISNGASKALDAATNMGQKLSSIGIGLSPNVPSINVAGTANNTHSNNQPLPTVNYNIASVQLTTASAVQQFFSIGNRNTQLELLGGSPLAGTTGV